MHIRAFIGTLCGIVFGFYFAGLAGEDSGSSIQMSKISAVLARAGFALRASMAACD